MAQYKRRVESAMQRNVISASFGKRKIAELDQHIHGADLETVTKGTPVSMPSGSLNNPLT